MIYWLAAYTGVVGAAVPFVPGWVHWLGLLVATINTWNVLATID